MFLLFLIYDLMCKCRISFNRVRLYIVLLSFTKEMVLSNKNMLLSA